jgi:hypothetical protein
LCGDWKVETRKAQDGCGKQLRATRVVPRPYLSELVVRDFDVVVANDTEAFQVAVNDLMPHLKRKK